MIAVVASAQVTRQDNYQTYVENAKVCGGVNMLLGMQGKWEHTFDDLAFPDKTFPRDQYKFVNDRVEGMLRLFQEAIPSLDGAEAKWAMGLRGGPYVTNGPVPYSFSSFFLDYYCNTNYKKIMLSEETGTWLHVFVNHFSWFCDVVDDWDINGTGKKITLYQLPKKVATWKGLVVYEPRAHGSVSRAVIIGHDERVPWVRITQKQYLTGLKNLLTLKRQQALDFHNDHERKIEEIAAFRLKNFPPDQVEAARSQTAREHEANRRNRDQSLAFFDEKLAIIADYFSKHSSETLAKPAVLEPGTAPENFDGRFAADEGGVQLIAVSGKYFRKDLPRYAPQFMVLYWRWTSDPVSRGITEQFERNFPLDKLKSMVDQ